jgi:hypothetical protein
MPSSFWVAESLTRMYVLAGSLIWFCKKACARQFRRSERLDPLLHLVSPALAVENMSYLSGAFALAPLRLFATANVGTCLFATNNLLLDLGDGFFFIFRHRGSLGVSNRIESKYEAKGFQTSHKDCYTSPVVQYQVNRGQGTAG